LSEVPYFVSELPSALSEMLLALLRVRIPSEGLSMRISIRRNSEVRLCDQVAETSCAAIGVKRWARLNCSETRLAKSVTLSGKISVP
jgi:hypothetical protein